MNLLMNSNLEGYGIEVTDDEVKWLVSANLIHRKGDVFHPNTGFTVKGVDKVVCAMRECKSTTVQDRLGALLGNGDTVLYDNEIYIVAGFNIDRSLVALYGAEHLVQPDTLTKVAFLNR
jgi:hypothetical protein